MVRVCVWIADTAGGLARVGPACWLTAVVVAQGALCVGISGNGGYCQGCAGLLVELLL